MGDPMETKKSLDMSVKSFIVSMAIIVALMVVAYSLTFILPSGEFDRTMDENGNMIIDTTQNASGTFTEKEASFPVWKFILSPVLVLGSEGSATLIMILVFLLVIGGIFEALTQKGLIEYLLKLIVDKFYEKRRVLLFILPLIFMLLASCAGVFEESVPLVPIVCAMAVSLGWDSMTGLCLSVIPCALGYAAGLVNPFGTGVAQKVAGVVVFGGISMRIVSFVVLYAAIVTFILIYTSKYEKAHPLQKTAEKEVFVADKAMSKGLFTFGGIILAGVLIIVSSVFIKALQDYTLVVFALCFLIGGILGCRFAGMSGKGFIMAFLKGVKSMSPALVMILFASSIKYILTESLTIDSLVMKLMNATDGMSRYALIIFIYLIVLLLEFFVPSGSAKAFLLIPLLIPIGTVYNLPVNLIVLAYIFGDGLANVMYPTNPALLIALNLADSNYPKYVKFAWKLMLPLLILTCLLLCLALKINYA